jgi:hypothetical protein
MATPLLLLGHDCHRNRAQLRGQRNRPPPLVAAGCDLTVTEGGGRGVVVGGLAMLFGTFPSCVDDLLALATSRLHMGDAQAREMDAVFANRILAIWAWLPTRRQDLYLEHDRATGTDHLWLIGPGEDQQQLIGADDRADIDAVLLESVVLNGAAHWGGAAGLERLVERHGRHPLLVAAQVADHMEHHPRDPLASLDVARSCWPSLTAEDESVWLGIPGSEHPWAQVQLGRLALRLGLLRVARLLLAATGAHEGMLGAAHIAPVALFDLAQACEALDDHAAAEGAHVRYAAARPHDPDAWRRLLFCRLRLGRTAVADEGLRRYRSAGGKDEDLAHHLVTLVARPTCTSDDRARLAAFLAPHLAATTAVSVPGLLDEACRRRAALRRLRSGLVAAVSPLPLAAASAALLAAPLLSAGPADAAAIAAAACACGADPIQAQAAASTLVRLLGLP